MILLFVYCYSILIRQTCFTFKRIFGNVTGKYTVKLKALTTFFIFISTPFLFCPSAFIIWQVRSNIVVLGIKDTNYMYALVGFAEVSPWLNWRNYQKGRWFKKALCGSNTCVYSSAHEPEILTRLLVYLTDALIYQILWHEYAHI